MNKQTKELNRINNELDKQLNSENNKVLTNIICYLRGANISEYDKEVIWHDLLEMVLSAQSRGENIQAVIGEDYKVFCDNIIASLPPQSIKKRILEFLDTIFLCAAILGAINIITSKDTFLLIRNIVTGKTLNFQIFVSLGSLISYGIIIAAAFIIVQVIYKTSFKPVKKGRENRVKNIFTGAGIGAGIMAIFLFIAWIGRDTLFTVNIFAACGLILVLYIVHKILARNY